MRNQSQMAVASTVYRHERQLIVMQNQAGKGNGCERESALL